MDSLRGPPSTIRSRSIHREYAVSTYDESALIEAVRKGDVDSFPQLMELYRPRMVALAASLMSPPLRQKLDPEDVAQETAMTCMKSLSGMDLTQLDPFDWIAQVIRRRVIDAARHFVGSEKRSLAKEVSPRTPADQSRVGWVDLLVMTMTTPSAAFSRDERMLRLSHAMNQLPEDGQTALRLRYLESLPSKEIAARMHRSDGAVRVLLTRTLQQLRQVLGDESFIPRT